MDIINSYLTPNPYSRPCTKRSHTSKIAVHYVGNAGTTEEANRNYFENLKTTHATYVSSNYIIGLTGKILCCVPDEEVAYCTNQANAYSVSIEVCHPKSDGVFSNATYVSLCELCAYLLKKYKLTTDDLIRHYDVTGKQCPLHWVPTKYQSEALATARWNTFKRDVQTIMDGGIVIKNNTVDAVPTPLSAGTFKPYIVKVIDPELNVRADAGVQNRVVAVITDKGKYTIVEEKKSGLNKWGKLKSGIGWINLGSAYVTRV